MSSDKPCTLISLCNVFGENELIKSMERHRFKLHIKVENGTNRKNIVKAETASKERTLCKKRTEG